MHISIHVYVLTQSLLVPSHDRTHLRPHTYLIGKGFVPLVEVVMAKQTEKMDLFQMDGASTRERVMGVPLSVTPLTTVAVRP